MAADKKRKFMLTHHSYKKGCEGEPGTIVEVDDTTAKWLEDVAGGYEVDAAGKPLEKKSDEKK